MHVAVGRGVRADRANSPPPTECNPLATAATSSRRYRAVGFKHHDCTCCSPLGLTRRDTGKVWICLRAHVGSYIRRGTCRDGQPSHTPCPRPVDWLMHTLELFVPFSGPNGSSEIDLSHAQRPHCHTIVQASAKKRSLDPAGRNCRRYFEDFFLSDQSNLIRSYPCCPAFCRKSPCSALCDFNLDRRISH